MTIIRITKNINVNDINTYKLEKNIKLIKKMTVDIEKYMKINKKDIELVMFHAKVTRYRAINSLIDSSNDIVTAIMNLTMG